MIDDAQIDTAVASAKVALAADEFSWIRESALRERAYFWGLWAALRPLASDEQQFTKHLAEFLLRTSYARSADAPWTSTETWRAFEELKGMLMGEDAEAPAVLAAKDRLLSRIAELERNSAALIGSVKEALEAVPRTSDVLCAHSAGDEGEVRARRTEAVHRLCERMEHAVCRLSQLEVEPNTI